MPFNQKEWRTRPEIKEKIKLQMREWRRKNKDKRKLYRERYYNKYKGLEKETWLIRTYNITQEQYDTMLKEQNYVCAFPPCGKRIEINGKSLSVDHDHDCCSGSKSCGKCIRGILCQSHNSAVRSLEFHLWAQEYINKYKKR
jgi:hypothetical protein